MEGQTAAGQLEAHVSARHQAKLPSHHHTRTESSKAVPEVLQAKHTKHTIMDPAFVPSEITVRHLVHHKFTFDIGPSIQSLGKPIRSLLITLVGIYCVTNIIRASVQSVFNKSSSRKEEE
jgi:hypothetical protein